jgi:hypothetical protein
MFYHIIQHYIIDSLNLYLWVIGLFYILRLIHQVGQIQINIYRLLIFAFG